VFAVLLSQTKSIIEFLSVDRVAGIGEEAVIDNRCVFVPKTSNLSETHFYGAADMMDGVLKNKPLLDIIKGLESSQAYHRSHTKKAAKDSIAEVLKLIGPDLWQRLDSAIKWFKVLKAANKLMSSESFPMSAYISLVQAMRNELNNVLNNEGGLPFDDLFRLDLDLVLP
jgi:hypothetical protein